MAPRVRWHGDCEYVPEMRTRSAASALLVVLALASAARGASADDYDAAVDRSMLLEREGRHAEAIDLLTRARVDFPQDFTIALRLGWLSFLAARYEVAEAAYRDAVRLSGGQSAEARSGLGWTLLRLGRKREAAGELRAAVDLDPADAVAADGLALALAPDPPIVELFPAFALVGHWYSKHPYKSYAGTASLGASVLVARRLLLGATYRGSLFAFDPSADLPRRATTTFAQHEAYASIGWSAPRAAALAQGAVVDDGSGFSGTSYHLGGTLRYSPWGDGVLAGSYSRYPDVAVGRAEVSWRIPLGERLWVRPAVAAQRVGDETLATGYGTVGYDGPRFGAWAGGKLGDEVRPAYLSVPFVMNVPERVLYGGWGGVRASLGERWIASLSGEVHVLERTDGLRPATSPAVFGAIGVARSL